MELPQNTITYSTVASRHLWQTPPIRVKRPDRRPFILILDSYFNSHSYWRASFNKYIPFFNFWPLRHQKVSSKFGPLTRGFSYWPRWGECKLKICWFPHQKQITPSKPLSNERFAPTTKSKFWSNDSIETSFITVSLLMYVFS